MLDTWYKLHVHQPSADRLAATLYMAKGGSPEVLNFEVDLTKIERAVRAMHQCMHDSQSCLNGSAVAGDFDDDDMFDDFGELDEVGFLGKYTPKKIWRRTKKTITTRPDKHISRTAKAALREGKRAVTTRPDRYFKYKARELGRNELFKLGKKALKSKELGVALAAGSVVPGVNAFAGPALAAYLAGNALMAKYDVASKTAKKIGKYYKGAKRYSRYAKKLKSAAKKTSTSRKSMRSVGLRLKRRGKLTRKTLSSALRRRRLGRAKLLRHLKTRRSRGIISRGKSARRSLFRLGFGGGKFRISRPSSRRRSSSSRRLRSGKKVRRVSRSALRRQVLSRLRTVKTVRSRMKKLSHNAKHGRTARTRASASKSLAVMHIAARNLARQKAIRNTRRKVMATRVLSRPPRNRTEARKQAIVAARLRAKQQAEANRGYLIDDYGKLHQGNFALRSLEGPQSEMLVTANSKRSGDFERI